MKKRVLSLATVVALAAVLLMPLAAMAATTGMTTVTGTMSDTIAVTAPAGFAMPTLDPSASQPITSAAKTVVVEANGTNTWDLQAHEESGDGMMGSISVPADVLGSAMVLNAAGGVGDVSLTGTAQNLVTGHAAGSADIDVTFKQTVTYTDIVHNDYSITITFTVGFSA